MSSARDQLREAFVGAIAADTKSRFGLDLPTLQIALAKVKRRKLQPPAEREEYTREEVEALSVWMSLQLAVAGKETRAERSERNKAAWQSGDRSSWGGERRKRDRRRGWRNFSR